MAKDLTFVGPDDLRVVFRIDSLNPTGNVTVMETYGLDDRSPATLDSQVKVDLVSAFKKIPHTMQDFIDFANDNQLELAIADTNGDNGLILVDNPYYDAGIGIEEL